MGLFDGKRGVIMGVANGHSIAAAVAKVLHQEGAELIFSHLPDTDGRDRMEKRVRQVADPLNPAYVGPCDVGSDESIDAFFRRVGEHFPKIDFLVHSIAFAPTEDIKGPTLAASREGFKLAMDISVYSMIATARRASELMTEGGAICTMTYFGSEKVMPGYNMMGVCKAALDASVRYLAYDLGGKGVRVNAVSAGPLRTLAASAVGEFKKMMHVYEQGSPLKRNVTADEVGHASAYLLSDWAKGVTGEIHHVDCGFNVMGGQAEDSGQA